MIYLIKSRRSDLGDALQIQLSNYEDDNPYIGFVSKALGKSYLRLKNIPDEDLIVVPIEEVLGDESSKKDIVVYENEEQILEVIKNQSGFDYASLIRRNDS